jgi:uncharacterized DUF497 family protein
MSLSGDIQSCSGFEWDKGNSGKNWSLHRVSDAECEEVFFNQPLVISSDRVHSRSEPRGFALGRTDRDRWLFVAFTIRNKLIRVISSRDMTKGESRKYAAAIKRNSDVQE